MKPLYLVSGNKNKIREAQAILDIPIEIADIELEEIQSMNLEHVTIKKAEDAYKAIGKPLFVDDVGFEVEAWNSFPGPLVKHMFAKLGNSGVLKLLENEENRRVRVKSIVGFHDGIKVHAFLGEFKGTIAREERGKEGWGFDPIVIPEGEEKTLAELGFDHKNHHSHRALALGKLKDYLKSNPL